MSEQGQSNITDGRVLHPRRGIHAPRQQPPRRVAGSIRRTITLDASRPDGITGDLVQFAHGRDLLTDPAGIASVVREASATTRVAYLDGFRLTELETTPPRPVLAALIGRSVSTGFRAAVAELVPDDCDGATLLYSLLDDLPGAALVSGYALGHAEAAYERRPSGPVLQVPDLCAGFQRGGTIMVEIETKGRAPVVTGPEATPMVLDDDPLAWHELRAMGPHDMRRWRSLDLVPDPTTGLVRGEAYFRDSHVAADGLETIVHEYTVRAVIDPVTMTISHSAAEAHTLPWAECIEAEASGDRLLDRPLRGLRPAVREELVGITTCTHLNDTLRSFEDCRALLPLLDRP